MTYFFLFFTVGCIFLFWDDLVHFFEKLFHLPYKQFLQTVAAKIFARKKSTMKDVINELNNGEKTNFIKKSYQDMVETFSMTGERKNIARMRSVSAICSLLGIILAIYSGSFMLVPVLGLGFALLPMWITKFKAYRYRKNIHAELSVALSVVTTSYLRSENIIKAVEENLIYMNNPVKRVFSEFVANYKLVDKNLIGNIEAMSKKIDHKIFKLWCQSLIVCQHDVEHRHSLIAIVNQLDSEKKIQENLSLEIQKPVRETMFFIGIVLMLFPVLFLFGNNTLEILLKTFVGQCLTAALVVIVLITLNKAITLSDPVE